MLVALITALLCAPAAAQDPLRVCADPHNVPYSSRDGSGFENRIAALVASEIGADYAPVWLPQGRGYVRKTLNAGLCDVIVGVPTEFDRVRATAPYYRSAYVFVSRADSGEPYSAFDDPRLEKAKIGVQLVGDDLAATPPGHALAARGLVEQVRGYTPYGERPQVQRMIDDLASGTLDVVVAWGPQAAYFASRSRTAMRVATATPPADLAPIPFSYSISMGVRKRDIELEKKLDLALARLRPRIDAILLEYQVPRVETEAVRRAELTR